MQDFALAFLEFHNVPLSYNESLNKCGKNPHPQNPNLKINVAPELSDLFDLTDDYVLLSFLTTSTL